MQPGTYTVDGRGSGGSSGFPIRYELTTSGAWTGRGNEPKYLFLDRNGSLLFAVTSGLLQGSTPEEVIANACPGGRLDLKPTTATTLLGSPAIKASGTVAAACAIPYGGFGELGLDIGETIDIVVAGVDGHMVAVLGDIPATNAQALHNEFDAMVASMKLIA